jgi:hypothetical protein
MAEIIKLNDLLNLSNEELKTVKVRFNQSNGIENPMDLYLKNPEIVNNQWFLWRTKSKLFKVGEIAICLLKLSSDTWLLTTIKKITEDLDVCDSINYKAEELEKYKKFYGRVILKYHKTVQTQVMYLGTVKDELEVLEILPTIFDGDEFVGYDKVSLSYSQLEAIIKLKKQTWIGALENQKAVYLQTDKVTGKLYVGSATSDQGMLLSRWKNYIENGHGGNVGLKELVREKGFDYIKKNFQYTIIENFNAKVDDHYVLERESYWKEVLRSREFGYNKN